MKYILLPFLACVGALLLLSFLSNKSPEDLGVIDSRLTDCPDGKNCVSSQASGDTHRVSPITMHGSTEAVANRLQNAIIGMNGTVVEVDNGYLRAEFSTAFWKFKDDLECLYDEAAGVVHIRSASRVGYYDFRANRTRVEALRSRLAQ